MACWVGFQLPIRNTRLVQSKFHSIHGHMASFPNGAIRFALLMNLANGMQYTRTRPVPIYHRRHVCPTRPQFIAFAVRSSVVIEFVLWAKCVLFAMGR